MNGIFSDFRNGNTSNDKSTEKLIRIALAGNPNAGKTSLFNQITGQHQHIGNYPGVTVEKKVGVIRHNGYQIEIVDLPGTYSLTAYSPEEMVSRDYVLQDKPDIIVDVIDSTNLERNLYLCLQFQELGVPIIGALNMSDEAEDLGIDIDLHHLSKILEIPFTRTVGNNGKGVPELLDLIVEKFESDNIQPNRLLNYGREVESEIEKLTILLSQDIDFANKFTVRWTAIKLLEDDPDAAKKVRNAHKTPQLILKRAEESREHIKKHFNEDCVVVVGEQRYAYIHGAVHEVQKVSSKQKRRDLTEKIDRIVLNRYAGFFLFFLIMFLVYQITFTLGNPLVDLLDKGFNLLGNWLSTVLPENAIRDLVVDGIIGGVGGVIIFLPLVLLLFMGLSVLEDTGYMARAAFVMDKFFHLFGMHGRSFIPFMIATGCAVPAVLSARTLVNPRDRMITILVTPLMMCGAKTPVVAMLVAAFFPKNGAIVFWLVWFSGWWLAFLIALLFRKTLFRGDTAPFVMELPPYRFPTVRGILTHIWERSSMYLRKAGTIILAVSIVVWFILYYPKPASYSIDYEAERGRLESYYYNLSDIPEPGAPSKENVENQIAELDKKKAGEEIRASIGGQIGIFIEPALKPAGFDWRIGVGLIGGLAAKEVIISTLGIVYGIGEADADIESTRDSKTPMKELFSNDPAYNPAMALAMMFFVLIYVPCMAVLAVVKKEMGSWKWPLFLAAYTLVAAWGMAVAVFQIGRLFGLAA